MARVFYVLRYTGGPEVLEVGPFPPSSWYFDEDLSEPLPTVTVVLSTIDGVVDLTRAGAYDYASRRMVDTVRKVGEVHFEEHPLVLCDLIGRNPPAPFAIFRFRRWTTCLDLNKSEYRRDEDGNIHQIRRVVLDHDRIPADRHFFQLQERFTTYVASEAFVDAWNAAGLTGVEFICTDRINYWF